MGEAKARPCAGALTGLTELQILLMLLPSPPIVPPLFTFLPYLILSRLRNLPTAHCCVIPQDCSLSRIALVRLLSPPPLSPHVSVLRVL